MNYHIRKIVRIHVIKRTVVVWLKTAFYLLLIFSSIEGVSAQTIPEIAVYPESVSQGDAAWLSVSHDDDGCPPEAFFNQKQILMDFDRAAACYVGLIPVAQDMPSGPSEIRVVFDNQTILKKTVQILPKKFPVQYLTLPKSKVDLCSRDLERHYREKKIISKVFDSPARAKRFTSGFMVPVNGEISTPFGVRRFMNKQPKNPHSGVDFAAKIGAPVQSTNDGIVVCVGDHFFAGKSVYVDHGLGVISMYFHLSAISVKVGDTVQKGSVLGNVGSSGRSTGPHLHWGIRINNVKINPLTLIQLSKYFK